MPSRVLIFLFQFLMILLYFTDTTIFCFDTQKYFVIYKYFEILFIQIIDKVNSLTCYIRLLSILLFLL